MKSKLIILFSSIIFTGNIAFAQSAWGEEVFLKVDEKPLRFVLNEIRNQSNINLIFDENLVSEKSLSCNIRKPVEKVIDDVLKKSGLSYKKFNNNSAVIYKETITSKKTKAVVRKTKPTATKGTMGSIIKPTLISDTKLEYPQSAIIGGIEGEVIARLLISKKGSVMDVILDKTSGSEILDTATINYVKKLSFLPAELNGKNKEVWTSMVVRFNFE